MVAKDLRRKSTGLSPAHVELIKLLAEIAVSQYIGETEGASDEAEETHELPVPHIGTCRSTTGA